MGLGGEFIGGFSIQFHPGVDGGPAAAEKASDIGRMFALFDELNSTAAPAFEFFCSSDRSHTSTTEPHSFCSVQSAGVNNGSLLEFVFDHFLDYYERAEDPNRKSRYLSLAYRRVIRLVCPEKKRKEKKQACLYIPLIVRSLMNFAIPIACCG